MASPDDLAPDFAALGAEAGRVEPRVVRVATRYKTVLIVETERLVTVRVGGLSGALKSFRRRENLATESS